MLIYALTIVKPADRPKLERHGSCELCEQSCGKLCTGVIYAVMMVHVIVPTIPQAVSAASAAVCAGLIVLSLVVYTARYIKLLGGKK